MSTTSSIQGVTIATSNNTVESVATDSALWVQNWEAKKWSDVDLNGVSGGTFMYDPVIISLPNGKVHAFAVGTDFTLYHKWYSQSTGWSGWLSTGKKTASSPIVTHYGTATANTFAVLYVEILYHIPYGGISTSDTGFTWTAIGDGIKKIRSDSLAALDRSYDQSISVVGVELTTGQLFHTWTVIDSWANSWEPRAGVDYCLSKPTIVCCKASCIDIFVLAADRTMRQLSHRAAGVGWGTGRSLGGSYASDPTSISVSPGRIDVFGIGIDGYIYRDSATLTANELGTFTRTCIGAPSISSPKVQVTSPGVFSVTTRKSKGVYQQIVLESTTGVWTPSGGMTEIVPPVV
ncbi:uncharacterized protein EAE98_010595 [Botrytis deweyae]|uniref:PLL-like beta propeller domain-containing protein n=1 Tax=Botrytis deweyae TaxID=2478750 RepID=A0ABQ7I897_9HELO|nr:uncharacterized protein EAE98_010595 [Botrytis deweyae]KAF7916586.1 hypothetical protein EAE98_010595 [Botrytis deweyae]